MKVTIDEKKLLALKTLMESTGGEYTEAQIAAIKIKADQLEAYVAELSVKWPETFGEPPAAEETPAPTPEPAPAPAARPPVKASKPAAPVAKTYRLRDAQGILHDLELLKDNGTTATFQYPVKREVVTVTVKGKQVEFDLDEAKKHPEADMSPHGINYRQLVFLGELAKAE